MDIGIYNRHYKIYFKLKIPEEAYLKIVDHLLIVCNMSIHSSHISLQTMIPKVSIPILSVLLKHLASFEKLDTTHQIPVLRRLSSLSRLPKNSAIDNEGITT
jgi:hypothetical protein